VGGGATLIHLAAQEEELCFFLESLLSFCPVLVNEKDDAGGTAVHHACVVGAYECLSVLLTRHADALAEVGSSYACLCVY